MDCKLFKKNTAKRKKLKLLGSYYIQGRKQKMSISKHEISGRTIKQKQQLVILSVL